MGPSLLRPAAPDQLQPLVDLPILHFPTPAPRAPRQTRTSYVRIDGEVSPAQRHEAVARFQAAPTRGSQSARVALLSLHAAGVGLTLTAASVGAVPWRAVPWKAVGFGASWHNKQQKQVQDTQAYRTPI